VPDGTAMAMAVAARDTGGRKAATPAVKPGVAAEQEPSANPPVTAVSLPSPPAAVAMSTAASTALAAAPPGPALTPAPVPVSASAPAQMPASTSSASPAAVAGTPSADLPPTDPTATAAASARPAPGFWVQLGVFRQRDGAEGFHRRVVADLDWLAPLLAVFNETSTYRLQAGPYASRDQANEVAKRVRDALNLVPVIVERR